MREELCFDVRINEAKRFEFLLQRQQRARQGNVELDLERGRGQHQATDGWRIIVHPSSRDDRAHTLRHHRHILHRDAVSLANVPHKIIGVLHKNAEVFGIAAHPRRAAQPARIPGKAMKVGQIETIDHLL